MSEIEQPLKVTAFDIYAGCIDDVNESNEITPQDVRDLFSLQMDYLKSEDVADASEIEALRYTLEAFDDGKKYEVLQVCLGKVEGFYLLGDEELSSMWLRCADALLGEPLFSQDQSERYQEEMEELTPWVDRPANRFRILYFALAYNQAKFQEGLDYPEGVIDAFRKTYEIELDSYLSGVGVFPQIIAPAISETEDEEEMDAWRKFDDVKKLVESQVDSLGEEGRLDEAAAMLILLQTMESALSVWQISTYPAFFSLLSLAEHDEIEGAPEAFLDCCDRLLDKPFYKRNTDEEAILDYDIELDQIDSQLKSQDPSMEYVIRFMKSVAPVAKAALYLNRAKFIENRSEEELQNLRQDYDESLEKMLSGDKT